MEIKPKVLEIEFYSRVLQRKKKASVLLPEGNSIDQKSHPVLFLLHGYGGNRHTWLKNTSLLNCIKFNNYDLIVVLPESGRRWFINDIEGFQYENYLIDELVPYINMNFSTILERDGRAIGGFSMGGAASIFQLFRHPEIFSVAFSQSGAFEAPLRAGDPYTAFRENPNLLMPTVAAHEQVWGVPGSMVRQKYDPYIMVKKWKEKFDISLYLDLGTEDYQRMLQMNRNFHQALLEKGIKHKYFEGTGGHDWNYVDKALGRTLHFVVHSFNYNLNTAKSV